MAVSRVSTTMSYPMTSQDVDHLPHTCRPDDIEAIQQVRGALQQSRRRWPNRSMLLIAAWWVPILISDMRTHHHLSCVYLSWQEVAVLSACRCDNIVQYYGSVLPRGSMHLTIAMELLPASAVDLVSPPTDIPTPLYSYAPL